MSPRKRNRYDQILIGLAVGLISPLIVFFVVYQLNYSEMQFSVYLRSIWQMKIFLKILSLCVFPNLGYFFLFYRMKYDMAARGVILATFMYAFTVLIAKLI